MNPQAITPISEPVARLFTGRLLAHAADEHGTCRRCGVANCEPARAARFELVMAGRMSDPLLR